MGEASEKQELQEVSRHNAGMAARGGGVEFLLPYPGIPSYSILIEINNYCMLEN